MLFSGKTKNILKHKSGEAAISEIERLLSPIFYSNPPELTEAEKTIVYFDELEREVNNGGFKQFFDNSSGKYSKEVVQALKDIRSVQFLKLVESAIAQFPNSNVPVNWVECRKLVEEIEEVADPVWDKLSREFFKYEEDIYTLMIGYINNNIKDFR